MEGAKEEGRKEGRKKGREKGRIRKGKWFSRGGELGERQQPRAKSRGGEEVVRRAGVQEELEGVGRSEQGREKKQTCKVPLKK